MIKFIYWAKPLRYARWFLNGGQRFDGKNGRHEDLQSLKRFFNIK